MFFFYIVLIIIVVIFILIRFSTIKIHINNVEFSTDRKNGELLNENYKIEIKLYLLKKIRYFKINITKTKIERQILKMDLEEIKKKIRKNNNNLDIKALKSLKYLKCEIDDLKLDMNIGLKDAANCAMCVGTVSSLISILLGKIMQKNNQNNWNIIPIYQNRNMLSVKFDCIIKVKLKNILYILYYFVKQTRFK